MSLRPIWLDVCRCGHDVAAVQDGPGGMRVVCDLELGGCGAEGSAEATPALAIANWNGVTAPGAQYLVAAAARRAMAEGVGE